MIKDPTMMSNLYFLMMKSLNSDRESGEQSNSDFWSLNELNAQSISSQSVLHEESLSINRIGFSNLSIGSSDMGAFEIDQ